ncbi:alpha/beta hydrolase [bacterium]|nr:MAG: alpha/beta hydrolase [bacterium]
MRDTARRPSNGSISQRNNVRVYGNGEPILFAHGFGCDQSMWRFVAPAFSDHTAVLLDHVGCGASDIRAYDEGKYSTLEGYADDIIEIGRHLALKNAVFVGHSVSSMIGALAVKKAPDLFKKLVMVAPSPRYINDDAYVGGFSQEQIDELLAFMESNYIEWASQMAPVIMGNPHRPELSDELTNSFRNTTPAIAKHFARVTFTGDYRAELATVDIETLILQCSDDPIAPTEVGKFVHDQMPNSELVLLEATGHCPQLSAPSEVISEMAQFV